MPSRHAPHVKAAPAGWSALLNASSDLLALLDDDGGVVWANARFEQATGHRVASATHPCKRPRLAMALMSLLIVPACPSLWGEALRAQINGLAPAADIELEGQPWRDHAGRTRVGQVRIRRLGQAERIGSATRLFALKDMTAAEPRPMPPAPSNAEPPPPHAVRSEQGTPTKDPEVHRLAEALHQSDEQLNLALELGRIGIWRHDLRDNRIFYNDTAFRILGMRPRLEGMNLEFVRSLIHPDDLAKVVATAQHALHSAVPVDMEARYRHANGSWVYVLTRRALRHDEHGTPIEFIGVGLDVTTQVEQLREASELAQRLESAASSAGVGIWGRNPKTGHTEWNDPMFKITGRSPELGGPTRQEWVNELVHPDDRAGLRAAFEASLDSTGIQEHEYRIVRPDGEVRWLASRARREMREGRASLFGITIDVTERVRTEAALRSANERIALAARSAGVGTWEWHLDTGAAIWDEAMFRLRGLEPSAQAPTAIERLAMVHPADAPRVSEVLREAVMIPHSTSYEFRVVWPDGTVRCLASRSNIAPDEAGRPRRRIGVNWDITEAKNAETGRRERELAQRESQAKSEFLSRMSHELRTPLNAVLGFAQLLQLDGSNLLANQRGQIAHIQLAGEHLLSLIDDVLDLSSLASNQLRLDIQPVSLDTVLRETLPLVDAMARAQDVRLIVGPMPAMVLADRIRLRQIMINLLSNAIKYNRPQGQVNLASHSDEAQVVLQVQDSGRGMTPRQLMHLFEPFNRLGIESEGIDGTGIGLAVVKALVERMGGTVLVSSEPEVGSRFEVRLPRAPVDSLLSSLPAPTAAQPIPAVPATPLPLPSRAGRLLYIEDNPVNVMLIEELVRTQMGMAIQSAINGEAGVEAARQLRPDLILIDIQLPDIDGFEVLRRLRAQPETAATPCIALSANAMPEDITRALSAGFSDYWTKPIDFAIFLGAMERLFPKA